MADPDDKAHLLSALAHSTNKYVQVTTLILIALAGIGNWIATWNSANQNKNEIEISRTVAAQGEARIKAEMIAQVAEIHRWIQAATDEFHKGNEDSAANRKTLDTLKTKIDQIQAKLETNTNK
jgi:Flp pilus assembly protein TadB